MKKIVLALSLSLTLMNFRLPDDLFTVKGHLTASLSDDSIPITWLSVITKSTNGTTYSARVNDIGDFELKINFASAGTLI